jgi:hypothetical protein
MEEQQTILPSFGVFTGGYCMDTKSGRSIYGIANENIFKVGQREMKTAEY